MSPISVAIAGATGDLGRRVVRRFLSPEYFPSQVAEVKFFTRDASSAASQELIDLGVKAIETGISAESFKNVDVFVSVQGEGTSLEERNAYVKAAGEAGVKVYIPTEFGIDYRKLPFEHPVWELKLAHDTYARSVSGGKLKVVSIYVGLFLDDTFPVGTALGLDTPGRVYTSVLSAETAVSFLSRDDIARGLAQLVSRVRGEEIKVETMGEEEAKAAIKAGNFWVALRYTMGYGLTDFSKENANEIINPGESIWKWKTVQEYVEETKGVAPENKQLRRE
ncbi:hypothetical protein M407DRAFT_235092 [Tulasnella calospora MUT 4182]|uniref:NmrA-like domain-containing protein n=1 Tax=Tulasnella calospora MUT 4182 TaxID=1051891 RepID=A0A0C3KYI8_9AGAM|nr:hypothetical protein M407DRAFT_235092 [Tulasnella calospora MUT 4182]